MPHHGAAAKKAPRWKQVSRPTQLEQRFADINRGFHFVPHIFS
jgi:hypothetical protein